MELAVAALHLASATPAGFLGVQDRFGRLAPGYRANMVALAPGQSAHSPAGWPERKASIERAVRYSIGQETAGCRAVRIGGLAENRARDRGRRLQRRGHPCGKCS